MSLLALILVSSGYTNALRSASNGDYQAALAILDTMSQPGPQSRALEVKCLLGLGQVDKALEKAKKLARDTKQPKMYYDLFYQFKRFDRIEQGLKLLADGRRVLEDENAFAREFYFFYIEEHDTTRALPELLKASSEPKLRYWVQDQLTALANARPDLLDKTGRWLDENPHPEWLARLCYDLAIEHQKWELAGSLAQNREQVLRAAGLAIANNRAQACLRILEKDHVLDDRHRILAGDALALLGRFSQAEKEYLKIGSEQIRNARLARLYSRTGSDKLLDIDSARPEKVQGLLARGQLEKAMQAAAGLDRPQRLFYTGMVGLMMGQAGFADSLKLFVARQPDDTLATQALTWLELVNASPAWKQYFRGLALLKAGKMDSVLAIEAQDSLVAADFALLKALAYKQLGQEQRALDQMALAMQLPGPGAAQAGFLGWQLALEMGDEKRAHAFLMALVRKWPRSPYGIMARQYLP